MNEQKLGSGLDFKVGLDARGDARGRCRLLAPALGDPWTENHMTHIFWTKS